MSRCEVFKEPNDIYVCRNKCDEFWSNFVHSLYAYFSVLPCCGLMNVRPALCSHIGPPLAPLSPSKSPSFIRQRIPTTHLVELTRTVPDRARLVYVSERVERGLNINIGLSNTQELLTRKFSVAYCNAYSKTKVIHKNRRYPQKLMFTHTVVPTVVL